MAKWNPADYAGNSSQQQLWARELIAKLHLSGNEDVLDIGCGDGKVTAEIAACVPEGRVVGMDNSPEMIRHAQQAHVLPNLSFVRGDASAMTLDIAFDVVFSNACLHWIYDHRPVLRGIACALRPGGRLLLQMGGEGNAGEIMQTMDHMMKRPEYAPYFQGFAFRFGFHGPRQYRQWMSDAGLKAQRVDLVPKVMRHAGRSGLAGWIRTTWMPYLDAVRAERRDAFLDEFVDAYLADHPIEPDGTVPVRMVRLEVQGTR